MNKPGKIIFVAALDRRGVIGSNGQIPWRLSADMRFFKEKTLDKAVIMGRKTYESIGRPLPRRHNIVLTRQRDFAPEGVTVVHSLDEALQAAGQAPEIAVIGGAEIYRLFWPLVDELFLTYVEAEVTGDTFFPDFNEAEWRVEEIGRQAADKKNEFSFRIVRLFKS